MSTPSDDEELVIKALVAYHEFLRERDPDQARQAWIAARDRASEYGLTIDDVVDNDLQTWLEDVN